jgi:hypothetical protein
MEDSLKRYLDHAAKETIPHMNNSALAISLLMAKPDPKLCLEMGAALLLDKPIIVVVPPNIPIPDNLRRVAAAIVQGDVDNEETKAQLSEAINSVLTSDSRIHRKDDTSC